MHATLTERLIVVINVAINRGALWSNRWRCWGGIRQGEIENGCYAGLNPENLLYVQGTLWVQQVLAADMTDLHVKKHVVRIGSTL